MTNGSECADDAMATARDGFTADGTTLYWTGSRGRDTAALIAEDVASAQRPVLGEHRKADVRLALSDPNRGSPGLSTISRRSEIDPLSAPISPIASPLCEARSASPRE